MTAASHACVLAAPGGTTLATKGCAGCASRTGIRPVRIPKSYPFGLLLAIAFALPLALALAVAAVWGSRDLFDIMAGSGGRNAVELAILRALPVAVALLLAVAALTALEAWCRRRGLRLSLCGPCARRQRRRRIWLIAVVVLALVALAAVLYLIPVVPLFDRKWGLLFTPWVLFAALLATETPLAGMRCTPLTDDVQRVRGVPALADLIRQEHPGVWLAEAPARFWPPRLELWLMVVPAAAAGIAMFGPRLEGLPHECPYGTYPLSHRSGVARVVGCRAPDGTAHGHARGEASAWNSNPQSPGYSGAWWFGRPHGEFAFLDRKERVLAQGRYVLGRPRGRWQLFDEWGTVLEELEVLGSPHRTIVHRAHPHLKCSVSEIEATGQPAWGTRACPRFDAPAPFVRVENARVVEAGMR